MKWTGDPELTVEVMAFDTTRGKGEDSNTSSRQEARVLLRVDYSKEAWKGVSLRRGLVGHGLVLCSNTRLLEG